MKGEQGADGSVECRVRKYSRTRNPRQSTRAREKYLPLREDSRPGVK